MMKPQPKHQMNPGGTSLLGGLLALILIVTLLPATADAQTRVTPINGTEGVPTVVEGRGDGANDAATQSGFAHLNGPAQHSSSRGLRLAGMRINITNRTSVFPNVDGLSSGLRARQLSGRELTVFGEITPRGIDAVLVIVQPAADEWSDSSNSEAPANENFEASASDPRVGRARNNTEE